MMHSSNNGTTANNNTAREQRRFVLFLGPPKTGSTSLQQFFGAFANKKSKNAIPAFSQWNYPFFLGRETGLRYLDEPSKLPTIKRTFQSQAELQVNIVAGSEFLSSHYRFLDGQLFKTLQNWTGGIEPEIIIMLRSPRVDHLISCWKQGSQVKGKDTTGISFSEWLCNPKYEYRLQRTVKRTINPLQVAYETVVKHNLTTTVVDMFGVSNAGFDVSHVVSCEILKVPCASPSEPWVLGLGKTTVRANSRHARMQLSVEQAQAMEAILQQRDCEYYASLANHPKFNLLYQHEESVWPRHCQENTTVNNTYRKGLLQELREIYQCPAVTAPVLANSTMSSTTNTTFDSVQGKEQRGIPQLGVLGQDYQKQPNEVYNAGTEDDHDISTQVPGSYSLLYEPELVGTRIPGAPGPIQITLLAWIVVTVLFLMGWISRRYHRAGGRSTS